MTTSNPFFTFHAGKRLRVDYANGEPEIYEIPSEQGTSPSEWKKLKVYDNINFEPLEIGFFMNQKDLFYEIISCFDFEGILTLRCVSKTWNNWIMIDFDELWKTRYENMCKFELSKVLLKNCQNSFLFNCYILDNAMKKHAKLETRGEYEIEDYDFYQDTDYEKIKKILEPRLFISHADECSKCIYGETVKDVNVTSMLNLGEYGFVKFYVNYFQIQPSHRGPFTEITVKHKLLLNNSIEEGKNETCLLKTYHDNEGVPEVKRNDELIAQIMSVIGIDRNLIRAFIMFVTLDAVFNYCLELNDSDYYLSLVGSEKIKQ